MKKIFTTMVGLAVLAMFISSAQAAIHVTIAEVQNNLAVVEGNQAAKNATVTWDEVEVTQTNNGGKFSFSGVVPADCVGTLSDGVDTVVVGLTPCTPMPEPTGGVLKTGQAVCYDSNGNVIACAGTGQDGELLTGTARSYTDNLTGTITDNSTGLVWEKLTNDLVPTIHDVDNIYTWVQAFQKVADLNTASFAGHTDWRLPNVNELQSLVDYGKVSPAIDLVFNTGTDSFTQSSFYWSSTRAPAATYKNFPNSAWGVDFLGGGVNADSKGSVAGFGVRAVRGGS